MEGEDERSSGKMDFREMLNSSVFALDLPPIIAMGDLRDDVAIEIRRIDAIEAFYTVLFNGALVYSRDYQEKVRNAIAAAYEDAVERSDALGMDTRDLLACGLGAAVDLGHVDPESEVIEFRLSDLKGWAGQRIWEEVADRIMCGSKQQPQEICQQA